MQPHSCCRRWRCAQPAANDWPSFGYDQQRSGWNTAETTLSPANVGHLKLLWSTQLPTPPADTALSTLTAPLVASGVDTPQGRKNLVFTVGIDDTIFAIDADAGKIVWQKSFPNTGKAAAPRHHQLRQYRTGDAGDRQGKPA